MAKKVAKVCKLQFPAGGAKPGPALASAGINMPKFCTEFNDKTKDRKVTSFLSSSQLMKTRALISSSKQHLQHSC